MTGGALADLTVLELGEFVSAPWTGKAMSTMGADVIKIEPPAGDRARRAGPFPGDEPHLERSALYLYLNTLKRSVTLDLSIATGRRVFLELVSRADIVLDNHTPLQLQAWGLDYEVVRQANPRVILVTITPFGWDGPWSHYRTNDLITTHTSGVGYETPLNFVTDLEHEPPLKGGEYQADMTAGWTAASAAMMAVRHRQVAGEGQHVDVSAHEAMANMIRPNIARLTYAGELRERIKRGQTPAMACKDGYVALSGTADQHWVNLVKMLGEPEWARDERFSTREGRFEYALEIEAHVTEEVRKHTKDELFRRAQEFHIPCFPYNVAPDLLESDQYEARGYWIDLDHPMAGLLTYPGVPYHFSATPGTIGPAPLLGQHNEEVYVHRLGYAPEDLRDFRQTGVV